MRMDIFQYDIRPITDQEEILHPPLHTQLYITHTA
jgi:hypothetical protein